ncbi:sensor histidine kinase N-terminal domain-containing protein [Hahella ganghwensis]|uniref:sensor histidine kinase N-terminal domain-containing protein n=1 Tax=Hahella ganghwensis TaxID=286420 RepID=UPI00037BECDA|nr:sensor histidine kinase N-terminal domain-containing protein [Hahella ganghwensis]
MRSIRHHIVVMTFSVVMIFLLLLCIGSYLTARHYLISQFDQELLADFQNVVGMTKIWPDGDLWVDLDSEVLTSYAVNGNKIFQVWTADGTETLDRSLLLQEQDFQINRPVRNRDGEPEIFDSTLANGRDIRAMIQTVYPQWGWDDISPGLEVAQSIKDTKVEVLVARDRKPLDQDLTTLVYRFTAFIAYADLRWGMVQHPSGPQATAATNLTGGIHSEHTPAGALEHRLA